MVKEVSDDSEHADCNNDINFIVLLENGLFSPSTLTLMIIFILLSTIKGA